MRPIQRTGDHDSNVPSAPPLGCATRAITAAIAIAARK
jgi:hypothetical protein